MDLKIGFAPRFSVIICLVMERTDYSPGELLDRPKNEGSRTKDNQVAARNDSN